MATDIRPVQPVGYAFFLIGPALLISQNNKVALESVGISMTTDH
jgi:hypothetical protein